MTFESQAQRTSLLTELVTEYASRQADNIVSAS